MRRYEPVGHLQDSRYETGEAPNFSLAHSNSLFTEQCTTIMFFQRFRSRRSRNKSKVEGDRNEIFRHTKTNGRFQLLNPTLSVDSEAGSVSTASQSAFENDDMYSGLGGGASFPAIIEAERAQQKRQIEELLEAHAEELADKDDEIARCNALLHQTESKLAEAVDATQNKDKTIADLQDKLIAKDGELECTVAELCDTKANLAVISSELIQTQHALHEVEEELNIFAQFGKGIYQFFSVSE
jgi:hypothetical protein